MFWNKNKESKEPKTIKLLQYQPKFITVDGVKHTGDHYNWAIEDFDVKGFLSASIANCGYITDYKGIMYPLANVLSIEFCLAHVKIVLDDFCHKYNLFFSDEEVEQMTEYNIQEEI